LFRRAFATGNQSQKLLMQAVRASAMMGNNPALCQFCRTDRSAFLGASASLTFEASSFQGKQTPVSEKRGAEWTNAK
jgi:hypothetical protein